METVSVLMFETGMSVVRDEDVHDVVGGGCFPVVDGDGDVHDVVGSGCFPVVDGDGDVHVVVGDGGVHTVVGGGGVHTDVRDWDVHVVGDGDICTDVGDGVDLGDIVTSCFLVGHTVSFGHLHCRSIFPFSVAINLLRCVLLNW